MKSIILLLFVMNFAVCSINAQKYQHKSEDEIARMTPTQRVDEWINEQVRHKFDTLDNQREIIRKYVTLDGIKALPRLIEIINQYDPTKVAGGKEKRGEQFDAAVLMLGYIDDYGIRLRSSEEGKRATDALDRAIQRMQAAGYGQKDQHDWERHGRFDQTVMQFEYVKGVNRKDKDIRSTLKFVYKITLSDDEFLDFSNFLTTHYPKYPSWSDTELVWDDNQINANGDPVRIAIMKKPESFYKSYLEFKKTKQQS